MIEAPQRFNENPEKATEIKKNGTEHFGLDQDGVAKTIAAELLLTKENVGLGNVTNPGLANGSTLASDLKLITISGNYIYAAGATNAPTAAAGYAQVVIKDENNRIVVASVASGDGIVHIYHIQMVAGVWTAWSQAYELNYAKLNYVQFNESIAAVPTAVGSMYWDDDAKTVSLVLPDGVIAQIPEELYVNVVRDSAAPNPIVNGTPVYTIGELSQKPRVGVARADDPAKILVTGIATHDIANQGRITTFGLIRAVPLSVKPSGEAWVAGNYLWLAPTGGMTNVEPASPMPNVRLGLIVNVTGSASFDMLVYIRPAMSLYDLYDVNGDPPIEGSELSFDFVHGYWKATNRLNVLEGDDTVEGSVAKSIKDAVTPIDTRVTYLESVRGHLYGVRMQKSSGICISTYDAIGLEFRPQVDTISTPSDFSSVYPWRDIKTVKVDADKNILCTIDDASFETTVGDIMVKIPVFWHRYWTDANYEYYEISDTPRDGFFAGGFYNPDMTIRPYALVGAVKTSNDGRVPHSWVDTPFTHSLPLYSTTAGFQLDALNKSSTNKWSNIDHQAYEMVWHLIFVEIGGYKISPNVKVLGFDVKGAIGQGINGMSNSYSASNVCTVATVGANTFIMAKTRSQYFKVGMLVQIGTAHTSQNIAANRYITDISEYDATNDVITVDGATFTTTLTSTIATWAQPLPLAQLMALKNESGYVLQFGANNLSHVCYRGIWDLWGNMYEWMSGLYRYDLQFYACFDWTKMNVNDPRGVAGWVATGIAPNVANGYLKTRQVYKGALGEIGLPSATGAGSATWYAAYAYYFNSEFMGLRAVGCGGRWYYGAYVGFLWNGLYTPSYTYIYIGGRLIG